MRILQTKKILRACYKYVRKLCFGKIAPDHGFEHAVIVAKLARVGLCDFVELGNLEKLLVMLAALMHDIDDPKVFKTENYANANAFLNTTILSSDDKALVIKMISLVSYSQNKNTISECNPKWFYIPRDADRIAGGGISGVERAIAFNSARPLIVDDDLLMFSEFPVNQESIKSKFNNMASGIKHRSLFEFYITNWYDRGVCASSSKKMQKLFTREYDDLLNFWVEQINLLIISFTFRA